jgi:hypothetical protein
VSAIAPEPHTAQESWRTLEIRSSFRAALRRRLKYTADLHSAIRSPLLFLPIPLNKTRSKPIGSQRHARWSYCNPKQRSFGKRLRQLLPTYPGPWSRSTLAANCAPPIHQCSGCHTIPLRGTEESSSPDQYVVSRFCSTSSIRAGPAIVTVRAGH